MNRRISRRPFALVLVAVAALAVVAPARGAERPYLSRGTARFDSNGFVGAGIATHLGRYEEVGTVRLYPTVEPNVFRVEASATYTAADGDRLYAIFNGQLNGATGVIIATVTYVGGTGRFANAGGTAALSAQTLADGSLQVAVEGAIEY
jgi:hypothetical protein